MMRQEKGWLHSGKFSQLCFIITSTFRSRRNFFRTEKKSFSPLNIYILPLCRRGELRAFCIVSFAVVYLLSALHISRKPINSHLLSQHWGLLLGVSFCINQKYIIIIYSILYIYMFLILPVVILKKKGGKVRFHVVLKLHSEWSEWVPQDPAALRTEAKIFCASIHNISAKNVQ